MRRRRGSALRGLIELVLLVTGIALLGLFVGLARGAELAPELPAPPPIKISAQACIELQVRRQAFGFTIGDELAFGELRAFTCDGYAPAAWVEHRVPSLRLVRLVELQRRP